MSGRQFQHLPHLLVLKCPHGHAGQVESRSLKEYVLGNMSGFYEAVSLSTIAILWRHALFDSCNHHASRRLANGFLVKPVVSGDMLISLGKGGELTAFRLKSAK